MDIGQWLLIIHLLVYNIKLFKCSEMQMESNSFVEVALGMDVGLTCTYPKTIQPPFFVYWVYDGRPIIRCGTKCTRNATGKYVVTIDKQLRNVRLTVQDTNLRDHGNYSCFLTTGSVTGRGVITLLIKENPACPTIIDIDLGNEYNSSAIVQAIFGTQRQFTCKSDIEFESLFRLRWMTTCLSRGNCSRFTNILTQNMTQKGDKHIAINFEKENYGVSLTCEVLWKDGKNLNISTTVNFNTRAPLEYVILTSDGEEDGYKNHKLVPVIAGVRVEFSCFPNKLIPVRRPVWVTWKTVIQGEQICQQGNIRLESPELCTETTSANVILEERDQGKMLTCEIYDREKDFIANRSIIIDVIDPPNIRTNIPYDTNLVEGLRNISLVCSPSKKQCKHWNASHVQWGGRTDHLEQFWSNEAGGQVLQFSEVQRKHSGRYICTVSLSIGMLEAHKDLNVSYSPIIEACLTKIISAGRIATISCTIAAYPMPSIVWMDAVGNVINESVYINMSFTVGESSPFQPNTINSCIFILFDLPNANDLNTVTCVVSNVLGSSNISVDLPWLQDVGGPNSGDHRWVVICAVVLAVIFVILITITGLLLRKKTGRQRRLEQSHPRQDRRALPPVPLEPCTQMTTRTPSGPMTPVTQPGPMADVTPNSWPYPVLHVPINMAALLSHFQKTDCDAFRLGLDGPTCSFPLSAVGGKWKQKGVCEKLNAEETEYDDVKESRTAEKIAAYQTSSYTDEDFDVAHYEGINSKQTVIVPDLFDSGGNYNVLHEPMNHFLKDSTEKESSGTRRRETHMKHLPTIQPSCDAEYAVVDKGKSRCQNVAHLMAQTETGMIDYAMVTKRGKQESREMDKSKDSTDRRKTASY